MRARATRGVVGRAAHREQRGAAPEVKREPAWLGGRSEDYPRGGAGGEAGGPGSGERMRAARDRGKEPHTPSRWSIISMYVDGGALDELGRSLAAAACKGGAHGGVVLLQDVRLEGRFAAATVQESQKRLPGLRGVVALGPRMTGHQGVK